MKRINNRMFCACLSASLFLLAGQAAFADPALGDGLFARIATNRGDIVARLEFQQTPLTVTNFVALAEGAMNASRGRRFYDGLTFHRVISRANGDANDFMIQGGCPQGNGMGGPGYRFPDEIVPALRHNRPGVLSMANAGPGTNGSQFFITIVPTPHLDGRHTVFGHVVQGQNVVNNIRQGDRIESVTIIRNGAAASAFRADQAAFDSLLAQANQGISERVQSQREADLAVINSRFPDARTTDSGIRYIVQRQGTGVAATAGSTAVVNYTGALLSGRVFDSSNIQGRPLEFVMGNGAVIPGWEEMVMSMRVGERRTAVIPPELAFGASEIGGGVIPANSFLVLEMELIAVR